MRHVRSWKLYHLTDRGFIKNLRFCFINLTSTCIYLLQIRSPGADSVTCAWHYASKYTDHLRHVRWWHGVHAGAAESWDWTMENALEFGRPRTEAKNTAAIRQRCWRCLPEHTSYPLCVADDARHLCVMWTFIQQYETDKNLHPFHHDGRAPIVLGHAAHPQRCGHQYWVGDRQIC